MDWRPVVFLCFIGGVFAVKPVLRPSLESVEKSQNESYVVFCSAEKEKVVWTGPKGRSIAVGTGRIHVEDRGDIGQGLLFDRITAADRGRYTCTSVTKDSASFELSVVKTSQFVNTPTVHKVTEFQSTTIRCEVEGEPKPTITWQKNGVSVENIPDRKYLPDSKGLKIINATKSDAGVFTCRSLQVGQEDGFIETVDITLKVLHKPEWKEPVAGNVVVYGYVTGETNLTCEAIAQPEANYTWTKDNKDIKSYKTFNATQISEPDKSVLQLLIHDESVYGKYKCVAKNNLGTISRMFELQKGEKPDPPTGLRVLETDVHNATLKIASEVQDLVGYRVQFVITRPGVEVSWDHPHYQDLPKTDNGHYVIIDLLENTSYTVRVATRSLAGLSDFTTTTVDLRTKIMGETSSSWKSVSSASLVLILVTVSAVH